MSTSKQKSCATSTDHCEGSIVRIKLENILTFDSVEFKCGPHLNVIIGPNGTGKSSIVCGICLGLAGKPTWLGRATQISDYITYGMKKGKIELELKNNDGDNWNIQREINRDNSSKWMVNGRPASQKAVEDLVGRLNIQVNNLTQFLPQEKVADFAKMTECELLENTEKSVGHDEMYERHQRLKESRTGAITLEQEHKNLTERLEQERQKNSRIEQDVKNFEEREKFLLKIKNLQMKKAWVEYEQKRQDFLQTKEEKADIEKRLNEAKAAHAPLQKKLDEARTKKEKVDGLIKSKAGEQRDEAKKAEATGKEVDNLTDKLAELQDELKFKRDQEDNRRKRLKDLGKQLNQLQKELANTEETGENLQPQIDQVNRSMREVTQQMSLINHQGDGLRTEIEGMRRSLHGTVNALNNLRSIENQRMETLRARHKDTYDAVTWLRQNKDMFQGTIYEPIMLCVNMKNPRMAKYLESHISFNDMRAFVCDNTEDMNLLMDTLCEKQKLRVNAVRTPRSVNMNPAVPVTNYRQYGFHSYLQEMFTCPDSVMKFLCAQYNVQNIPVGDHRAKEMVGKIVQEKPNLSCFYTADNQYNISKSRYDGEISSRNVRLKEASLLTVSMDEAREKELLDQKEREEAEIQMKEEQYRNLQQQSRGSEQQLNTLREEKKQLMMKKDVKKRLQSQIESKNQTIKNVESDSINLEAEEERVLKKVKEINRQKLRNLNIYSEVTQKLTEASIEKVRLSLRSAEAMRKYNQLEAEIREQSQSLEQAKLIFANAREKFAQCKNVAKRYLEIAKKATDTGPNEELSTVLKDIFSTLPNTLEDIENKIHENQARADVVVQTDERVIQEYNKRNKEIARLETQLVTKKEEIDNHQETIDSAKDLWLRPLTDLVSRINESFSRFFQCLKCVGEVNLHIPENSEDYSKYGIRIRVKFRDSEPLRELSPHHQSGGERSVTTVLFMLAMQELTRCPFRCVDEINQGMDPVNERKIFELVVQTVCKKTNSQYFLLTPKLLPNLEYEDNMCVLIVFNGPYMLNHTDWNVRKFLRRRKKLDE